jgi:AcrR family transcriptional regulator
MKTRILEQAQKTFFQSGFYRITMDELAHNLGISKKTLYKHFPSKEILLEETMQRFMDQNEITLKSIVENDSGSVLEKLQRIFTYLGTIIASISIQFTEDLRRYAPHIWQKVDRRRMQFLHGYVRPLIEMGVKEGIIRQGIPPEFIFLIYSTLVQQIINPESLSRLPVSVRQAFVLVIQIVFLGTLTEAAQESFRQSTMDLEDPVKGFQ